MATIDTLQAEYRNVMRVQAIPAADAATLTGLAAQVDASSLTLAAATDAVVHLAINTTTVATFAYNFFTGATPRAAGLDYLVSPTGPNPNNINSAYYQSYALTNRYIDFSVNLGKFGEGAAAFAANYGALSLTDATTKAYTEIFGTIPDTAKVNAILSAQVPNGLGGTFTRAEYFAVYGKDGLTGIGTKAAMVGWLLGDAAVENIGAYAVANNAFLVDLAPDGVANFNVNLVAAYGPPPPAGATISFNHDQSVTTTATDASLRATGYADVVTGSSGLDAVQTVSTGDGNDTITVTGVMAGLIDGGAGNDLITVDTLNAPVSVLGGGQNGAIFGGAGDDTIVITTVLQNGAIIDGGGGHDVVKLLSYANVGLHLVNVEEVVVNSGAADFSATTGLQVVRAEGTIYGGLTLTGLPSGTLLGLRSTGTGYLSATYAVGTTSADIHLDNVHGYPPGHVTQSGMIGIIDPTNIGVLGVSGAFYVHVDSDSEVGIISNLDGNALVISGPGALTAGVQIGRGPLAASTLLDASAAGSVHILQYAPAAPSNVVTLSAGADVLEAYLTAQVNVTITLGGGADVLKLPTNGTNPLPLTNLAITGATATAYAVVTDFAKGVDQVDLGAATPTLTPGLTAFVGSATTLEQALINISSHVAAGGTGVFEYAGSTWIYHQNATVGVDTGDGLIKLVGVTGLSTATGGAVGDIHYG